jgi:hypothetical protein
MSHSGTVITMQNVPALNDDWRELYLPLACPMWPGYDGRDKHMFGTGTTWVILAGFRWNGHSSGILSPLWPKWNHPIASCRHDARCEAAKTPEQRKWADIQFRLDVGTTSWGVTKWIGYAGVRVGALLGIGVRRKTGKGVTS